MSDDDHTTGEFRHEPVLLDQVVELFTPVPPGWVVDATVGGAGHATAILERHQHLKVLGLDQDADALAVAAERLRPFGDRSLVHRTRFDALEHTVNELGTTPVSGVLFDLGVSSPQLDRAERGFSYRHDAPLDMRMDQHQERTASDIVNETEERELASILKDYGDERFARRIAAAIVAARPVHTTGELAELVREAIPAPARRKGGHPAKRTFQAIRIAVNGELEILPAAIDAAIAVLAAHGRCAVLSYHSGEDKIVKARLRHAATGGWTGPSHLPPPSDVRPTVRLLKAGSWTPSLAESTANRRASSARLRAAEKLDLDAPTPAGASR
ncbi:MAG: 16S rRNA (cytosine(1402)-N(4))-methyltransferase RsmH [Acidimicrobiales bacterium]